MKQILFDSDVLIEYLKGNQIVRDVLQDLIKEHAALAYSVISQAEIYHGLRNEKEENSVELTFTLLQCLDIDKNIGSRAGRYLRKYAKSHGLDVADGLIAATAVENDYALCTFNWKHYPMTDIKRHVVSR